MTEWSEMKLWEWLALPSTGNVRGTKWNGMMEVVNEPAMVVGGG